MDHTWEPTAAEIRTAFAIWGLVKRINAALDKEDGYHDCIDLELWDELWLLSEEPCSPEAFTSEDV